MNIAGLTTQRMVDRPPAAGPAMPADLRIPNFAMPHDEHRGTTLSRLGAPPSADSEAAVRDFEITRAVVAQRTPAGDDWARAMDQHGGTAIWRELALHLPGDPAVNQSIIGAALAAASTQAGIGKRQWERLRPFQQDPTIHVVGRTPKLADSSYPSGHAARAFAGARVIARLDPSLANTAYAMAREVSYSRIYAGVHFASDVVAGARLGLALAESTLDKWRAGTLLPQRAA